ncbi:BC1872 family protein [Brevibacillus reuszeri]|uniref:BC1872 family protein n=1 Tax=Brevibacillus reuszeri TaxID=54915 RepID=UPI00289BBA18|nr:hypothetical protein [Brevibacillus reuszeri]
MTEQQIIETLATKVMGWSQWDGLWCKDRSHTTFICKVADWNPLQNIADAWMIVEEMRKRQYYFVVAICFNGYEVYPERVDGSKICGEVYAETAPRAISMAAYKLVA